MYGDLKDKETRQRQGKGVKKNKMWTLVVSKMANTAIEYGRGNNTLHLVKYIVGR